jgi:Arc/MetJ-type ribon-helix-helix transcriptional regulator
MKNRKRINVSVDCQQYQRLQELQRTYGFKNVCELTRALLNILTQYTDAAAGRRQRRPASVGDDILDMFNDLGDWETTPENVQRNGKG